MYQIEKIWMTNARQNEAFRTLCVSWILLQLGRKTPPPGGVTVLKENVITQSEIQRFVLFERRSLDDVVFFEIEFFTTQHPKLVENTNKVGEQSCWAHFVNIPQNSTQTIDRDRQQRR